MYITLNIATTSIRLLSVSGRRVKEWGSTPLEAGLIRDGLILQPKAVGAAIDSLFKSTKVSKEQVIISVSGLPFTHRILNLPRMKPELVEEAIELAARREIPLPLEELYLSWQAIGGRDDEVGFFVMGVPRKLIDAVIQTMTQAGITSYLIDLKQLALARAANRKDALIVSLEPDCFDIILVADGIPAVMHTITQKGEGASIEDKIQRLKYELSRTVGFYNSSHAENPLDPATPLLLTGELVADAATRELIQSQTEHPIELLTPELQFSPRLPLASYAANMGLALKKVSQKKATDYCDINLDIMSISDRDKTKTQAPPMRARLRTVALVIAISMALFLYQTNSSASAESLPLITQLNRVTEELHQARIAGDEARQAEDTISEIVTEADILEQEHQQILSKGKGFANYLRLVTDALPPEAYFTSIKMGANQFIMEGEARRPSVVVRYSTTLEQLQTIPEVRIAEIVKSDAAEAGDTDVSFAVVITR